MQSQNQVPVQIPTSLAATGALTGLIPKTCTWMIQALSFFCLSPLDNRNGYAVYDSANGARVGTLLWGSEKEADWQAKAQMEDLDHDGIKEIGISMADGEILWYHYREGLEDTWPENKCGCFEKVD